MSTEPTSSTPIILSALTVPAWKRYIKIQALKLNAWNIVNGKESEPDSTSDAVMLKPAPIFYFLFSLISFTLNVYLIFR